MPNLDYISCVLTVLSTVLVGKKLWQGWVVAAVNSVVICVIGMRTVASKMQTINACVAVTRNQAFLRS